MKTKGWDINVNSINIKGKFQWNTSLIFNYNADKVTKAYRANTNASLYVNDGNSITALEGYPVHSLISFKWAGLDNSTGNPMGYLNGAISNNYAAMTGTGIAISDLEFSGSAMPELFGSITNTIIWNKLELNCNIAYKFRYYFRRKPLNYSDLFNSDKKSSADFSQRWQNPGDEKLTDIPSFIYPLNSSREYFYSGSATLIEKGDHMRLQFINLSYKFSLRNAKGMPIGKIQVFGNASNLGILWRANTKGIDPDYPLNGIPIPPSFAVGVKVLFQ